MDLELIEKLDQFIKELDNNKEIKRLKELKEEIYKDKDLKIKLNEFNKLKDNIYDPRFIELKKEILSNENVNEYKKLENNLYLYILSLNKKLNSLIDKGGCNK